MTTITNHYIVDMASNNNFIYVPAMQGDGDGTRYMEIELRVNGSKYTIPTDAEIVITGIKPDGTNVFNPCTVNSSGYIVAEITQQMTLAPGRGVYQIGFISTKDVQQIKSFPFYVVTMKSAMDAEGIVSSNEYKELNEVIIKALADYDYVIAESKSYANQAATSAKSAGDSVTKAANSATASATSATNSANSATAAANSATNAENYSNLSKSYAVGTNGTVRTGDAKDNSKYYYEQTIAAGEAFDKKHRFLSKEEYQALSDAERNNGTIYYITNDDTIAANEVSYDSTTSKLGASTVQAAIDKIASSGASGSADKISYSNAASGLAASNVQLAIDETNAIMAKVDGTSLSALKFGIDANGNYGYYKAGADTVTPFSRAGVVPVNPGDTTGLNLWIETGSDSDA